MIVESSPIGERIYDVNETTPADHIGPLLRLLRNTPNSGLEIYLRNAVSAYNLPKTDVSNKKK
jgi:hypothetical protein